VHVLGVRTAADADHALRRQGPALASVLFAADAGVAAALASIGAVSGLHLAGRRRRYELSALAAAGCPRRSLHAALWLEQATVLGSGLLAGAAAGVLAARLALPAVPEFVHPPAEPALLYGLDWPLLGSGLAALALAALLVALLSSAGVMARLRPDQLREAGG
jgi:putative ABC transport system permease protein